MAQFSVKYGQLANLPEYSSALEGTLLFTTDSHELFANVNGAQFKVGAFDSVATLSALSSADTSKMYYVRDIKALAVYNASKTQWEQVNADTGATAVAFSGGSGTNNAPITGEYISGATYSAATRTITFAVTKLAAVNVEYKAAAGQDPAVSVKGALDDIYQQIGDGGSVASQIQSAIEALDGSAAIASESGGVVTLKSGVAEADGVISNSSGSDITLAKVATTGDADDVVYEAGTGGAADITVKDALDTLNGADNVTGSVAKAVKDAVDGLDVTEFALAEVSSNVVTIHGISETDGEIAVGVNSANDIVLEEVAYTGAAADVSVADAGSNFTGTTVEAVLAEIATAISNTNSAGVVTVETPTQSTYASVYEFYQGLTGTETTEQKAAKKIGTINIPKDMVISAGEVKTVATADVPYTGAVVGDKYIDLTIANNDGTHIYIPVKDLVDVYTGSVGAEVTITVSNANVIGATVNKVAATKIVYAEATTYTQADYEAYVAEHGEDPTWSVGDTKTAEVNVKQKIDAVEAKVDAIDVDGDIATEIAKLDATVSIEDTAGTNPLNITVTEVDGKLTAVTGSIDANTFDAYGAATAAVAALDADLDASGTAQHSGTFVVSGVTEVDGVITAVDSVEVENAGAAAAVLGTSSDAATANTVYGAKAAASAAQSDVDNLETLVGTIPGTSSATDIVGYVQEQVTNGLTWGTF